MICDMCGENKARIRKVSETYGKGKDLIVIEDIPMVNCLLCGEGYFTAQTLHEIERIKLHHKNFAVKRQVEVAQFV
ncbi:hypothetical protein MNBD_UNCLBAC01-1796 [hydrothermal vent metagenome]|uniref:YgiT-type zinc finger domain protein n=1 Tax=hydrothermal vent metagenome TaxID=652676 RepID=A0A3B1D2R8_9ZZZZ